MTSDLQHRGPGVAWLEQRLSWRGRNTLAQVAAALPIELVTTSADIPAAPFRAVHRLPPFRYEFQRAPDFARVVRDLHRAGRIGLSVAYSCIGFLVRGVPQLHICGGSFFEQQRLLSRLQPRRLPHRRLTGFVHYAFPEWLSCRRAHGIIAVSQATRAELIRNFRRDPDDVCVMPPGVGPDYLALHARKQWLRRPRLLFVGRLDFLKGIRALLEAFSKRRALDAEFLIVGEGPDAGKIEALAARDPRIRPLGGLPRGAIQSLLTQTSIFVFPSLYEGVGQALIEAMASGTPCLAYDAPVFREVLGETGVFARYNRPEEMVKAIEELISDPDRLHHLSAAVHARAGGFTWERTAAALVAAVRRAAEEIRLDGWLRPARSASD